MRFNFGIQTFDDEILNESWRGYRFEELQGFLRQLIEYKKSTTLLNADFIAFGKWTKMGEKKILRNQEKINFFRNMVQSHIFDSFSLYTLELFPWSKRYYECSKEKNTHEKNGLSLKKYGSDDEVYEEFSFLKKIIFSAGYRRYELSNFSLLGKSSIHNRVYWTMEEYLGLGISGSSFLKEEIPIVKNDGLEKEMINWNGYWFRFTHKDSIVEYMENPTWSFKESRFLNEKNYLIEKFFLGLRTSEGIRDITFFNKILIPNRQEKIQDFVQNWFMSQKDERIVLTDKGMDVYNTIVSELLNEI